MAPPRSNKRVSSYSDEGDGFVASDNDTANRPPKKPRTTKSLSTASLVDAQGETYWELSRARRVTISNFKGKTFVNIREYYEKDGKDLPGKKGIAMNMEQYCALVEMLPQIEKTLKEQGETVPRPKYGETASEDANEDEQMDPEAEDKKPNIEATSDEEDDE